MGFGRRLRRIVVRGVFLGVLGASGGGWWFRRFRSSVVFSWLFRFSRFSRFYWSFCRFRFRVNAGRSYVIFGKAASGFGRFFFVVVVSLRVVWFFVFFGFVFAVVRS